MKTNERPAETKGRTSMTRTAKATAARARKSTRATEAGDKSKGALGSKGGAESLPAKKSETRKRSSRPVSPSAGGPGEMVAAGPETAAVAVVTDAASNHAGEAGDGMDGEGRNQRGNAGDAIKPLTEAGKKRLVNKLLGLADSQATQGAFKITPADLIRLMQLHREMTPQKNRKVTVQWIEDKPE